MKKFFNKLSFLVLLFLVFPVVNVLANENLYQGYSDGNIILSNGKTAEIKLIRISDRKGINDKDTIVYCYDINSSYPNSYNDSKKTYYKRIESYLNSMDELTNKYGKDKKGKIAIVLKAGYPNDAFNYLKKYEISENDAIYMTQDLIWKITQSIETDYTKSNEITENMANYGNALLKLSKKNIFTQGKLSLNGNLEFTQHENFWITNKLSTTGDKGNFRFKNLSNEFTIFDANTNKEISGYLSVGQDFYIKSTSQPSPETKFKLEYEYSTIKIYFYKCISGKEPYSGKDFQNLIRSESINKRNTIPLELKINGDFEKTEELGHME